MSTDGEHKQEVSSAVSVVNEDKEVPLKRLKKGAGFTNWQRTVSVNSTAASCGQQMPTLRALADQDKHMAPEHDDLCSPAQQVVKIPSRLILDLMLQKLSLPKATYDFHTDDLGQVSAIVTFYTSTHLPGNLIRPVKIGGAEDIDVDVAEESAAKEAIRFVESCESVEVEDLHFSELKHVKQVQTDLLARLHSAEDTIDGLQRGLWLATRRMIGFSKQINGIATNHFHLGQPATGEDMRELVKMFEGVAFDLGHAGRDLKNNLKQLQKIQRQRT